MERGCNPRIQRREVEAAEGEQDHIHPSNGCLGNGYPLFERSQAGFVVFHFDGLLVRSVLHPSTRAAPNRECLLNKIITCEKKHRLARDFERHAGMQIKNQRIREFLYDATVEVAALSSVLDRHARENRTPLAPFWKKTAGVLTRVHFKLIGLLFGRSLNGRSYDAPPWEPTDAATPPADRD